MNRTFELIPAIDLLDGQVVRLEQGDRDRRTVYSSDPVSFARRFEEAGATRLHIVDLNGAFGGKLYHLDAVREIAQTTSMRIELGGGIRDEESAQAAWDAGVGDVILGTRAVEDKAFTGALLEKFPDRVIIGIDARDGIVTTRGWTSSGRINALDFAAEMRDLGCMRIIYTDIATDGMLSGPNIKATQDMTSHVPEMAVVASGGIGSVEDVIALAALDVPNLVGAITGRALYDGRIDLARALQLITRS